ncbi:excitatory amino acid transporter 2 isoform X3 [Cimex lectularius]|uniref:Amino acid transporter n=1 Tax=Cimex lectularius TaxID=79782 RepID=A0A8I6SEK4_CIMLE|nr:excitatory amino acid transporter 2 isoform X3 [Cimex lectularius]
MKKVVKDYLFTRMAQEEQESKAPKSVYNRWIKDNLFLFCTAFGVIVGAALGFTLRTLNPSDEMIMLISYPGELFMRILKLMILPFVISCLIMGTATLNIKKNGKIAVRTLLYFILTSLLNVLLAVMLTTLIHPGDPHLKQNSTIDQTKLNAIKPLDSFLDMGRNLVPDNLFQAAFEQTFTVYNPGTAKPQQGNSSTNSSTIVRDLKYRSGTNTLGIIFFCLIFGSVLGTLGPHKSMLISFFNVIYEVLLKMMMGAIWLTPFGVGSIICGKIISLGQLTSTMEQLGWFVLTMAAGVFIYQWILLQLIYLIIVRKNPFKYYIAFGPSIVTSFATASKSAAMPITIRTLDEKLNIDKRISRFIIPIGTINMDGTALFITTSIIFIAQMNDIPLDLGRLITVVISCTVASMSSATIPSAALVLVLMLCSTINAPVDDVSLLFAVDWFVDRLRTTNNLLGDCYACAVIQKLSKKELTAYAETEQDFHETTPLSKKASRTSPEE